MGHPTLGLPQEPMDKIAGFRPLKNIWVTPLKTNIASEHQWLEDVFPIEIVPLKGDMLNFAGVVTTPFRKPPNNPRNLQQDPLNSPPKPEYRIALATSLGVPLGFGPIRFLMETNKTEVLAYISCM